MSEATLFELTDFAPAKPAYLEDCELCAVREDGTWPSPAWHERNHRPVVCPSCGEESPSAVAFSRDHGRPDFGDAHLCTALFLRLNHLVNDLRDGRMPSERDLKTLDLGFYFAPDGTVFRPDGWDEQVTQRVAALPREHYAAWWEAVI